MFSLVCSDCLDQVDSVESTPPQPNDYVYMPSAGQSWSSGRSQTPRIYSYSTTSSLLPLCCSCNSGSGSCFLPFHRLKCWTLVHSEGSSGLFCGWKGISEHLLIFNTVVSLLILFLIYLSLISNYINPIFIYILNPLFINIFFYFYFYFYFYFIYLFCFFCTWISID